jgi:ABC-type lipoprotein release transport system permease subunit
VNAFFDTLRVIAQIALRNLFASRVKTLIVGGIIGFGACIVVFGTSLLDSIDQAMSRSITGSVAGDIQVYSSESKEVLDVFGGLGMSGNDVAPIPDFARLRHALLTVPNVAAVVPMGIDSAMVPAGNSADQLLAALRVQATKRIAGDRSDAVQREYTSLKDHVHQIIRLLKNDYENAKRVRTEGSEIAEDLAAVDQANTEAFWNGFDEDPLERLEFLENRIAPLVADSDLLYLRYIGTDPQHFQRMFDRMTIVEGQSIPQGKRGFLFSKYVYEEQVKLKTARILDKLKRARDNRGELIAKEPELQRMVHESASLTQEILLQLDARKTELFRNRLQALLQSAKTDVEQLLIDFFALNDANFERRYQFYYQDLAPELQLYKVKVGDTLTVKAFARSGYVHSANLKVYGIYAFRGLEQSPQAGAMNLIDLVSFRDLYGYLTADRDQEIRELRAQSGATEIARENAEQALFGAVPSDSNSTADDSRVARPTNSDPGKALPDPSPREPGSRGEGKRRTTPPKSGLSGRPPSEFSGSAAKGARLAEEADQSSNSLSADLAQISGSRARSKDHEQAYDPVQLEQGIVLNAAVFIKDRRRLAETVRAIDAAAEREHLLIKALPWYKAVGITGQFTVLMRAVLYTAVGIIFLVALIIINNALVMATLERIREFGTLRAIGAQRRFLWAMIVLESAVTGLLFGIVGSIVGGSIVAWFTHRGIPAWNDVVTFFFSGPRLFPSLSVTNLVLSLVVVLAVSIISSAYPAWIAMRVSPRQAMQSEE